MQKQLWARGSRSSGRCCDPSLWLCAAALDFSKAFDSIDIEMLRWADTLCEHWSGCSKWTHYGSISGELGFPQGDPASLVMLVILFWYGSEFATLDQPRESIYQTIWLDDRTIVAQSQALVDTVVGRWRQFAELFDLQENVSKTMEVLGAVIGRPHRRQCGSTPSNPNRVTRAIHSLRRIGTMPSRRTIKDIASISRPTLAYGWVSGNLGKGQAQSFDVARGKAV